MATFIFADNWYDGAYRDAVSRGARTVDDLNYTCHGTADGWDIALRAAGHESYTVIDNLAPDVMESVLQLKPTYQCCQNVGRWNGEWWHMRGLDCPLIGFCSYAADTADLRGYDLVLTSFPWYVEELKASGINAHYLPLAFQASVLRRVPTPPERDIPVSFVGGLGGRIWPEGQDAIARLARSVDGFQWWGYQNGTCGDTLAKCYQGEAWGHSYYELLLRSRISVNRHGTIARGYANNMRMFEATGCGSCLVTEHAPNISDFFEPGVECMTYRSASELIDVVRWLMANPDECAKIAVAGQKRTLAAHCYENRVPTFIRLVESL